MSTSATGQRTGQGSTSVRILDESKPPLDLTVTAEHLELLNLSTLISRHSSDRFNLSFSIMLLGLYFGSHRISGWFRRYVDEQKVDVDSILEQQRLDRKSMDKIVSEGAPVVRGADRTLSMRDSPRLYPHTDWLERARRLASEQKHHRTGLRHVMAAVIFDVDFHVAELERWGFDRAAWGRSYLSYVANDLPNDLGFYQELYNRSLHPDPNPRSCLSVSVRWKSLKGRTKRAATTRKIESTPTTWCAGSSSLACPSPIWPISEREP